MRSTGQVDKQHSVGLKTLPCENYKVTRDV